MENDASVSITLGKKSKYEEGGRLAGQLLGKFPPEIKNI
jgi:hypothetical protein